MRTVAISSVSDTAWLPGGSPGSSIHHAGCTLAYAVHGEGPPVVMIQGAGVSGSAFGPLADRLCPHHRCLTFDNRGLRASQPCGGPVTVPRMADDVIALMDAQGWDSAHLLGHSMGGLIALETALNFPRRVRSLSLLCSFARGRDVVNLRDFLWKGLPTILGPGPRRRRAFVDLLLPPGELRQDFAGHADRIRHLLGRDPADQPPIGTLQLAAIFSHDVRSRLPELGSMPTLVVSAQYDRVARPAASLTIARGIPNARYVGIPDAAHGLPILSPDRVAPLLLKHLAQW